MGKHKRHAPFGGIVMEETLDDEELERRSSRVADSSAASSSAVAPLPPLALNASPTVTAEGPTIDYADSDDGGSDSEQDAKDQEELAFLRVENALLKKKVKELERVSRGEKRSAKLVVDEEDIQRIDELLKKAEDAKTEAMNYVANTSRDRLGHEVKMLQSILKKAKAERHVFKKKIKAAEERLRVERQKIEKEEIRFQVDREIFAKILQDDRDAYKQEVNLLVQKMTELQREKHELFLWTKEQQERHLHEIRKLTRALGRTKKMVEEQASKSMEVLQDVLQVQSMVLPPPAAERVSTPSA
ncbi:hypothetical protein PINS_up001657 [Pythium insidiosum]|nr:hypothetical protein PINS_up001657 [Pythium insidiosum]